MLPLLHGPMGEDGTVQGLLELADVAYVGSGVAASALAMDKDLFKSVMRDKGVPVARSLTVRVGEQAHSPFGFPCVVKPARLGSSVGINIVHDEEDFDEALELAFIHDEKILVEEFLDGVEVECSVLGNTDPIASVPGHNSPAIARLTITTGGAPLVSSIVKSRPRSIAIPAVLKNPGDTVI